MSDDSGKSFLSAIPLPGLIAVITGVISTILTQYEPLTPRRPTELNNASDHHSELYQIEATPYEDPFAVITRSALIPPDADTKNIDPNKRHYLLHRPSSAIGLTEGPLLVLPVFLKPGLDQVTSESRARTRLAIIEGLASSGYIPKSGRIECCRLSPSDLGSPPSRISNHLDLPLERFTRSKKMYHIGNGNTRDKPPSSNEIRNQPNEEKARTSPPTEYKNVIVLWIPGDELDNEPIAKLRKILNLTLGSSTTWHSAYGSSPVQVISLGPHNTATLVNMVKEAKRWMGRDSDHWPHPIYFISHAATAPADFVLNEAEINDHSDIDPLDSKTPEKRLNSILSSSLEGGSFHRAIKSDNVIAEALVQELEARGVKVKAASHQDLTKEDSEKRPLSQIAIISEFDSPYGRAFPSIFLSAAKEEEASSPGGTTSRWHWFNFPRGLDGRTTGSSTASEEGGSKEKGDSAKDRSYSPGEIPDGPNQADALRRMAEDLRKLDLKLAQRGGRGIEAIGLMGGDVFDKLWLMRALKPHFPKALFFTDNLDAWLWQRDELRTTRNLIIASPFGLSLANKWQIGKPPFRESYQTSAYASTLAATGALPICLLEDQAINDVRLYEIGSKGPHDLAPERPGKTDRNIHPEPELRPSQERFYGILAIISAISAIALCYWSILQIGRTWQWLRKRGFSALKGAFRGNIPAHEMADAHDGMRAAWIYYITHPFIWIIPITVVSILSTFLLWHFTSKDWEPLHLLSGISAWPSQGFRIAAILLAIHLTGHLLRTLKENGKQLERTFFRSQGKIPKKRNLLNHFFDFLRGPKRRNTNPRKSVSLKSPGWLSRIWCWPSDEKDILNDNQTVNPAALWLSYRQHTGNRVRCIRALCIFLVLLFFYFFLMILLGSDIAPIRGTQAMIINTFLSWTSTSAFLWLTAIVIDAMWTARMFALLMTTKPTFWNGAKAKHSELKSTVACDYMDLEVIAERTRPIVSFAFYPFYVLVLLIIARGEFFDHWIWPKSLIAIYIIAIALVLAAAKMMRTEAENIRETLLKSLNNGGIEITPSKKVKNLKNHQLSTRTNTPSQETDRLLERYVSKVEQMKTGALAPISQQPIMKGVYWLLSGLGIGSLWQHFSQVL